MRDSSPETNTGPYLVCEKFEFGIFHCPCSSLGVSDGRAISDEYRTQTVRFRSYLLPVLLTLLNWSTRKRVYELLKAQLIGNLVLLQLIFNVLLNFLFVLSYRIHEVSPGPEMPIAMLVLQIWWLANPHSILRGGFSLSRAKAVFIPPAKLVVVARSSYPNQKAVRPTRRTAFLLLRLQKAPNRFT